MSLAISYHMKRKDKKMAKGGDVDFNKRKKQAQELGRKTGKPYGVEQGVHAPSHSSGIDKGRSITGDLVRGTKFGRMGAENKAGAKEEHHKVLGALVGDKKDRTNLAEGGDVCMHCGGAMMAEGGELADFDSADFDAGGFEGKEANETGANSGDELSTEGEEERKKSILSRILASRTKKAGHNPRPD